MPVIGQPVYFHAKLGDGREDMYPLARLYTEDMDDFGSPINLRSVGAGKYTPWDDGESRVLPGFDMPTHDVVVEIVVYSDEARTVEAGQYSQITYRYRPEPDLELQIGNTRQPAADLIVSEHEAAMIVADEIDDATLKASEHDTNTIRTPEEGGATLTAVDHGAVIIEAIEPEPEE